MQKVLHIITRLTLGGAQETVFYYYKNLNRQDFDVYLIAGEEQDFQDKSVIMDFSKDSHFTSIKTLDNSINPIKDIRALFSIYKFLKKNPMDIVHTHSGKAGLLGRIAAKMAGVKIIVHTVHGWSFNQKMSSLVKIAYISLERLVSCFSSKLITVTSTDINKGLYQNIGKKEQYVTIRSGIDFSKFDNTSIEKINAFRLRFYGKKLIGSVGRLSVQKNYPDFLRIAKELCRKNPDIHFVIVGDGELRGMIENEIRLMGLIDNVTILGLRTDTDVIMKSLDVLLMTSLWEGLPRVLPEAMYCGLPIVANAVDGIVEIVKDGVNGFLVEPGDIIGACGHLERILEDEASRLHIIENAKKTLDEFTAEKMLEDTELLYKKLSS